MPRDTVDIIQNKMLKDKVFKNNIYLSISRRTIGSLFIDVQIFSVVATKYFSCRRRESAGGEAASRQICNVRD